MATGSSEAPADRRGPGIPAGLRRDRVCELLARGLRASQILERLQAEQVKCSLPTIKRDIAAIRAQGRAELATTPVIDHADQFLRASVEAARAAWAAHDIADSANARVAALHLVNRILTDRVKTLQSLGVVFRADERLQVQHVVADRIASLPPDVQRSLAECADRSEFARLLTSFLGPELARAVLGQRALPSGLEGLERIDDPLSDDEGNDT